MNPLKRIREAQGITQAQLASYCDVDRGTISMIEIGKNKPSVDLAKRLGKVLGFDWVILFQE